MPGGLDLKASKAARPMRMMAAWYSPSIPFWPFHVSSAACSIVSWIMAIWRFLAEAGGAQYLVANRRTLVTAW